MKCFVFFFFQAEDGIRDIGVTGVQTCALPILGLPNASVIAPAAMLAVTLPPKLKCSMNRVVMFPLITWTLVTLPPTLPVSVRSLVWTEDGSTGSFQSTSY